VVDIGGGEMKLTTPSPDELDSACEFVDEGDCWHVVAQATLAAVAKQVEHYLLSPCTAGHNANARAKAMCFECQRELLAALKSCQVAQS